MTNTKLSLHILDNKTFLDGSSSPMRNQIYRLWAREWETIYAAQESAHAPVADGFFRYDLFTCITHENEIAGMSAHSFLHLNDEAALNVEFFKSYSPTFLGKLRADGLEKIMTYESLLVAPEFRSQFRTLPIAKLVSRLGIRLFLETDAQAATCIARNDNSASKLAANCGMVVIEKDIPCRNFSCDAMAMSKAEAKTLDPATEELANYLWENKQFYIGQSYHSFTKTTAPQRHLKVAA